MSPDIENLEELLQARIRTAQLLDEKLQGSGHTTKCTAQLCFRGYGLVVCAELHDPIWATKTYSNLTLHSLSRCQVREGGRCGQTEESDIKRIEVSQLGQCGTLRIK